MASAQKGHFLKPGSPCVTTAGAGPDTSTATFGAGVARRFSSRHLMTNAPDRRTTAATMYPAVPRTSPATTTSGAPTPQKRIQCPHFSGLGKPEPALAVGMIIGPLCPVYERQRVEYFPAGCKPVGAGQI